MNYFQTFGGNSVAPAQPSYQALTLSANQQLQWPLESTDGSPYVASMIDVTATAPSLKLLMPPGNTGSTGAQSIITNVGSQPFTVADTAGHAIVTIATTQAWVINLISNSTTNGSWRALQLASTTSSATAGSLAGRGLQVRGTLLDATWPSVVYLTSTALDETDRATVNIYEGNNPATFSLAASSAMGTGWFCAIVNRGPGIVTLLPTGADTINGVSSLVIHPNNNGFVTVQAGGFNTVGALIGVLPITDGGTGASDADHALQNLGGGLVGIPIFKANTPVEALGNLGVSKYFLVEQTVTVDHTLTGSEPPTAYVVTAPNINFNLPRTNAAAIVGPPTPLNPTPLSKGYYFIVYALGGAVTLTPASLPFPPDRINNATGVATIPAGAVAMVFTDTTGNWFNTTAGFLPLTGGVITGNVSIVNATLDVFGSVAVTSNTTPLFSMTTGTAEASAIALTVRDDISHQHLASFYAGPTLVGALDSNGADLVFGEGGNVVVFGRDLEVTNGGNVIVSGGGSISATGTTTLIMSHITGAGAGAAASLVIENTATQEFLAFSLGSTFLGGIGADAANNLRYDITHSGQVLTGGSNAPVQTLPNASLYVRSDGTIGTHLYASDGSGTWNQFVEFDSGGNITVANGNLNVLDGAVQATSTSTPMSSNVFGSGFGNAIQLSVAAPANQLLAQFYYGTTPVGYISTDGDNTHYAINEGGPVLTGGNGSPNSSLTGTLPKGSIYMQGDGAVGSRLWVGDGTLGGWLAVAGV